MIKKMLYLISFIIGLALSLCIVALAGSAIFLIGKEAIKMFDEIDMSSSDFVIILITILLISGVLYVISKGPDIMEWGWKNLTKKRK